MLFFFILFLFYHEYLVVYKFFAFCFQFFLKLLQTLPKKCPYSEFSDLYFPTFGLNTDQKNFKYGHFLCSETYINFTKKTISLHFISCYSKQRYIQDSIKHLLISCRRTPSDVFLGSGILKICSKFTGENTYRNAISIKLLCNFIEISLRHGRTPVNLLHIFRTPQETKNTSYEDAKPLKAVSYFCKRSYHIQVFYKVLYTQGRGKRTPVGVCEAQFCRQNILFLTIKVELVVIADFTFLSQKYILLVIILTLKVNL